MRLSTFLIGFWWNMISCSMFFITFKYDCLDWSLFVFLSARMAIDDGWKRARIGKMFYESEIDCASLSTRSVLSLQSSHCDPTASLWGTNKVLVGADQVWISGLVWSMKAMVHVWPWTLQHSNAGGYTKTAITNGLTEMTRFCKMFLIFSGVTRFQTRLKNIRHFLCNYCACSK